MYKLHVHQFSCFCAPVCRWWFCFFFSVCMLCFVLFFQWINKRNSIAIPGCSEKILLLIVCDNRNLSMKTFPVVGIVRYKALNHQFNIKRISKWYRLHLVLNRNHNNCHPVNWSMRLHSVKFYNRPTNQSHLCLSVTGVYLPGE